MLLKTYMAGHLGLVIDELDAGGSKLVVESKRAFEEMGRQIAALRPDTIVLSTPHNVRYADYFHISPGARASGVMRGPWVDSVSMEVGYDEEFVSELIRSAEREGIPAGTEYEKTKELDHGTMVPLKFANDLYQGYKLVRICHSGLPFETHYRLGRLVRDVSDRLGRRTVFIGSGDLSHKLADTSPYGYAEEGPKFEEQVLEGMRTGDFLRFFDFDLDFLEIAAECGLRSLILAAGTLDGLDVEGELAAHNPSYGVGCSVAWYEPGNPNPEREFLRKYLAAPHAPSQVIAQGEDAFVRLAKFTVEKVVRTGKEPGIPRYQPAKMMNTKHGIFVALYIQGRLRSLAGNLFPRRECTGEEVLRVAAEAAAGGASFNPVSPEELGDLRYEVYELPQPGLPAGDPGHSGILAVNGVRYGFVLPAEAEGITAEELATLRAGAQPGKADIRPIPYILHTNEMSTI